MKLLLQSQPKGGSGLYDRRDVTIWYKEVTDATYTSAQIAADWVQGLQVSTQQSAYSAMALQDDGKIAFFFEEAPCYGDDQAKGYCMVYTPLTIEGITKGKYFSPTTDLNATQTISVVLTDAQGNEYRDQVESTVAGVAAALATKYPFITVGDNANLSMENGAYAYTNSVTLPFKVSGEETTVWHNIYWPANTNENGYPVYLSASAEDDQYVPKVTESNVYGNSSYNTANNAAKISWAVYSVGNGFTFKFKNKLTGKFIQVTNVASGNAQNVKYVDEADATAFEIVKKTGNYHGDYTLKAVINGSTGYLCSTSATGYHYATHYNGNGHQGAWVKFAEAPDFAALIAEVNATLGMIGTGLGQYTASDANVAAAAAAKVAMQSSNTVKLNTLNTYKTLTEGATLNKPKADQFFRIRGISGNYIDASSLHDASTGQMSMKSAEACNYNGTIFYLDEDKHLVNYATGTYVKETSEIGTVGAAAGVWSFAESPRTGKGKYALTCTTTNNNGRHLHDNSGNRADRCSGNCSDRHDFTLEEVTELPFTISSVGYGTLWAPVALEIPEHVKAYTGVLSDDKTELVLTKITTGIIPAETGVVIYRDDDEYEGDVSTGTIHNFAITSPTESLESDFSGSVAKINAGANAYTLQLDNSSSIGVAFKPSAATIPGFKAYLQFESEQQAQSLRIRFADETTEMELPTANSQQPTAVYDLQGRRVLNPTKGVYIVNGKKVIVK